MNAVTVTPVEDRAATTAFIRLPYALYRDEPHWVAPLEREVRAFLDPRRNPFFETAEARLFLARRGRRTVGRIAAVTDPRFHERHDYKCGHFGLFECADDLEAAGALFDAAADWLAGRGLTRMLGPLSFSVNDECGLLVDGFDGPPSVGIPYNPPYYADLLTGCGFGKAKDLLSWLVPMPPDGEPPAAIARVAARTLADPAVRVRPLDRDRYEADMAVIKDIYNDAWAENYASVPLTDAEFLHMAAQLKSVVHPELVRIAEVDGEPAAFTLWVPDVNQALRTARGRLTTWGCRSACCGSAAPWGASPVSGAAPRACARSTAAAGWWRCCSPTRSAPRSGSATPRPTCPGSWRTTAAPTGTRRPWAGCTSGRTGCTSATVGACGEVPRDRCHRLHRRPPRTPPHRPRPRGDRAGARRPRRARRPQRAR